MWVRLDDNLPEHRKLFAAGRHLGANGSGRALAVYVECLCYANRNLTDGFLPELVVARMKHDRRPKDVATVLALPDVRLFESEPGGWRIHDYHHHNPTAAQVKEKRERDRQRKRVDADGNPQGILAESSVIPLGFQSARARDPDPDPNPDPFPSSERAAPSARRVLRFRAPDGTPNENYRVIRRLVFECLRKLQQGDGHADLAEDVKVACAKARIDYDGDVIRKALDSALAIARRYGVRQPA